MTPGMMRIARLFSLSLLVSVGMLLVMAEESKPTWKVGAASVAITPEDPLWMAGYASRTTPSDRTKLTELWAKALAMEDADGNRGLVISLDLIGIDRDMSALICKKLGDTHGLKREQITIATSHTHSGPVVGRRNLGPLHWWQLDADHQQKVDAYAEKLVANVVTVAGKAMTELAPARVQWGSGLANFAVNRRENPANEVSERRDRGALKGPIDHDVPVLSVRDPADGSLRAVLFGYACHPTTLSGLQWCGDYPGYAQIAIEKEHPGCVALFWAGCGADQNPLPRRELSLAEDYGTELAEAIEETLDAPMGDVSPSLTTQFREVEAPLAKPPTLEQLQETAATAKGYEQGRARYLLDENAKGRRNEAGLDGAYPYPVGVWTLGEEIDFIWLGGEVVVDYARRLKRERRGEQTWVAAYANDVMAYIPSLRVLNEGGYEGGESNVYYGLPALWDETIEETIIGAVNEMKPQTD